ncbi:2-C-methyl-D-erythritol 4-phosphate cytidylyltransferase [Glutamicibacter nicotianae]|uniref:2-C-methyl-D-erythritol 4-phosphate cytidylyltransferase n=1 Tax=Glutamicibacter nicotianae TaxID=37929 RepID=UPI002555F2BF|nr:2-C-methyl-D-erythritol 4-phosphate cytidylyltransferase [Glutamicibacter nicotianae]WIV44571.1 2-C-methyl-D-erythritol 4-phosphate cytidylyltransferase [Glutamicibacter nicotianae]
MTRHDKLGAVKQSEAQNSSLILVAAGMGTRLGAGIPKAMVQVAGKSLAEHAVDRILGIGQITEIIVVTPPKDERLAAAMAQYGERVRTVPGGASRAASVRAGLAVASSEAANILVHDAARAFAPAELHERVLVALADEQCNAVIPALDVTDTICVVQPDASGEHEIIKETPARSTLRAVQTPQGFDAALLRAAHARLDSCTEAELELVTDDASIVRAFGAEVQVLPGSQQALKVTYPEDLDAAGKLAASHLASNPSAKEEAMILPRVGNGIDVHAVSDDPAREMWLAGLHFPDDIGLSGHSDGDAVAHAACDALFSAAGIGDLGTHFGVDRPEFAGASGVSLIAEAARLVREAGFEIGNVSVQFVGRRPRFAARREEANAVLSEAIGAPVSVIATTSDGLGYEGEGKGVTAYATALVYPVSH